MVLLAAMVIAYGSVSQRLEGTSLTGPMVFTAGGLLFGAGGLGWLRLDVDGEAVTLLAETTLLVLLFVDAARIDLPRLRREAALPARMLGIALPVTIALGALAAWLLLDGVSLAAAAVLAAILSPTDAALGQAVVSDPAVPQRIRQTINVESGLNDGIVLPVVTILLALAGGEGPSSVGGGAAFVMRQIGGGIAIGVLIGCAGAIAIDRASTAGWMSGAFQQLATLAVAVACFAAAEGVGGNGFIASFVGGVAFGGIAREHCHAVYQFAEEEGTLLSLLVFAILGAALVPTRLLAPSPGVVALVVLSLTVLRMVPIVLSLLGTGLRLDSKLFMAWFGPRGLATILFGLLVVEDSAMADRDTIFSVALWTVLASVLAHGATAAPLARRYAARLRGLSPEMPEMRPATEFAVRG